MILQNMHSWDFLASLINSSEISAFNTTVETGLPNVGWLVHGRAMTWESILRGQLKQAIVPSDSPQKGPKKSAVLIPIGFNSAMKREEIVLTKRTDKVETHKGQVSFPGGFEEAGDADLRATALRETFEELGILTEDIEVLGALDSVETQGSIPIYPWVGRIKLPYDFRVSENEVDKLLYLPLEELLRRELQEVEVPFETFTFRGPGIFVDNELVWGATARILVGLRDVFIRFGLRP